MPTDPYSTAASPGDGITPVPMSREPLATEGEATPGPDDYNPFDERERKAQLSQDTGAAEMPAVELPTYDGPSDVLPLF